MRVLQRDAFDIHCRAKLFTIQQSAFIRKRYIQRLIAFMLFPPQYSKTKEALHTPGVMDLKRERFIHAYRARDFSKTFLAFLQSRYCSENASTDQLELAGDFVSFLECGGVEELARCPRLTWLNRYSPMRAWREWLTVYRGLDYALNLRDVPKFPRAKFVRSLAWYMALAPEYPEYPIASRPKSVKVAFYRHFAVMHLVYAYIAVTGGPRMRPDSVTTMIKNLNKSLVPCLEIAASLKQAFADIPISRPTYAIMPRADLLMLPEIDATNTTLPPTPLTEAVWAHARQFNAREFPFLPALEPPSTVVQGWDLRRWLFKRGQAD
jgi:hypothetical protein